MPLPLDIEFEFKNGEKELGYIPQYLMFGEKKNETSDLKRTQGEPWKWTHPTYVLQIDKKLSELKRIEIDPKKRTADTERKNNSLILNW